MCQPGHQDQATGLRHPGGMIRHPILTVHEVDRDCNRLLTYHPVFYCLKRNGVRGTWFKNAALRVPVRTGLCNDSQVQLIITEACRKSQHFPGETNWWGKAPPDDEQSPCTLAFPVINSRQCLSSFLRSPPAMISVWCVHRTAGVNFHTAFFFLSL